MIYLLDASVLIRTHNEYYGLSRVPEFWDWLRYHGDAGVIKLPGEIYAEVEDGADALAAWMKEQQSKDALLLAEEPDNAHVSAVLAFYGSSLTEADVLTIGKDPFLVAAALSQPSDRCVVTAEVSKPGRTGPRRHIPDICVDCGVQCMTPVGLLNALNFSTGWNSQ